METNSSKLANFPLVFYASVMGFSGLTLGFRAISKIYGFGGEIVLAIFTTALFLLITGIYIAKTIKFPSIVKAELNHPMKVNFFGAFAISMLLLANIWSSYPTIQTLFFNAGVVIQTFVTFHAISLWIRTKPPIAMLNPAWFIPIVGNLIVVLASKETGGYVWYYFSVGIFFWIVLLAVVLYRMIFEGALPSKFMPTTFILVAPPAIAFIGSIKLVGEVGMLSHICLSLTVFFAFLIAFMYKSFLNLEFYLSWWAFTFPVAAATMAYIKAYELMGAKFFLVLGNLTFIALVCLILIVSYKTIKAALNAEICLPE